MAAKFLRDQGFQPVVFERSDNIGGQWNAGGGHSGVWSSMRTNTSASMTCFSDVQHEGVSLYPHHRDILRYLHRYAAAFEVDSRARLNASVELVDSVAGGYEIRWKEGQASHSERFERVVIASGRYQQPVLPEVRGLASFTGDGGIGHSFEYKEPEKFWKKRVLVGGCAISALEIASDLVMSGAAEVVCCNRRQRYVLPKLAGGVPMDHLLFSRFAAHAAETFPAEMNSANLNQMVKRLAGRPEQYGAHAAHDDVLAAGVSLCQNFLPLVAEGRITTKPWIREVNGKRVTFEDDSTGEFDAIIFGTGYRPAIPFLSSKLAAAIMTESGGLATSNLTFHPAVPNLALVGMFGQMGPYFPVLELQARYLAKVWSGQLRAPIMPPTSRPGYVTPGDHIMHMSAILLSRAIGAEPDISQFTELAGALMFGSLPAISFRISGPDPLPHAADTYAKLVSPYCSLRLTAEQAANLAALEKLRARATATAAQS